MSELNFMQNIGDIPVYKDPYMEKDKFLVMYKTKDVTPPGYVYVPTEIYNEGLKTMKASPIEKDEVDEILRMKKNRNLSDVKAIFCNFPEKDIDKLIESLKKNFK